MPAFLSDAFVVPGASLLGGIAGLIFGSKFLSRSITFIANAVGVPVFVIALFLVAFSTSIPELTVGVTSALSGIPELSFGDIYGSNIFNLTFIAGIVLLISRKRVLLAERITRTEQLVIFSISALPVLMMLSGTFSRVDGIILICSYLGYLAWLIKNKRVEPSPELLVAKAEGPLVAGEDPLVERSVIAPGRGPRLADVSKELLGFALGVVLLVGGAQLVVSGAVTIAKQVHVPLFFIGVFLISVGTSLPELSFGIRQGLEKRPELSLGDVIGSAIANSALILGIVATIHPVNMGPVWPAVRFPAYCMLLVFALFFLLSFPKKGLSWYSALTLLSGYFIFLFVQIKFIGIEVP
jgi:cation:H+ antiporter